MLFLDFLNFILSFSDQKKKKEKKIRPLKERQSHTSQFLKKADYAKQRLNTSNVFKWNGKVTECCIHFFLTENTNNLVWIWLLSTDYFGLNMISLFCHVYLFYVTTFNFWKIFQLENVGWDHKIKWRNIICKGQNIQ